MSTQNDIIKDLEQLVQEAALVIGTHKPNVETIVGFPTLSSEEFLTWQSKCLSYLTGLLGPNNSYVHRFQHDVRGRYRGQVETGKRILKEVLEDVKNDYYKRS